MKNKISIVVKRVYCEDTVKRFFLSVFMPERLKILAIGSFDITTSDSCCGCPIRRGQEILLKPGCNPVEVNEYSSIIYNTNIDKWEIVLPTCYVPDPVKEAERDGFSAHSIISGGI